MKIIDISQEIVDELENPSDVSVTAVSFWLRQNLGKLNTKIFTAYAISSNGLEATPELGIEEKSIFKEMFLVYYYDKLLRGNLGAASFDSILEVSSDGATVKKTNKNEIAKTYLQLRKESQNEVDKLINAYRLKAHSPASVDGDDTTVGIYSPNTYYRTP